MNILNLLISCSLIFFILCANCVVSDIDKMDCGYMGINENQCALKGCFWASSTEAGVLWCFFSAGSSLCPIFDETIVDPGFTSDDIEKMRAYFLKNLNIDGSLGKGWGFNYESLFRNSQK